MKVKELIEKLKVYNQEMDVIVGDGQYYYAEEVEIVSFLVRDESGQLTKGPCILVS